MFICAEAMNTMHFELVHASAKNVSASLRNAINMHCRDIFIDPYNLSQILPAYYVVEENKSGSLGKEVEIKMSLVLKGVSETLSELQRDLKILRSKLIDILNKIVQSLEVDVSQHLPKGVNFVSSDYVLKSYCEVGILENE